MVSASNHSLCSRWCSKWAPATFLFLIGLFFNTLALSESSENLEFLPAQKAFSLQARLIDKHQMELQFSIAPGYFLYQKQFQFRLLDGQPIVFPQDRFPPALKKHDDMLNETSLGYAKPLTLIVPLPDTASTAPLGLRVQYQGCSDSGFCYAPITEEITTLANGTLQITEMSGAAFQQLSEAPQPAEAPQTQALESETDRISAQLKSGAFPLTLLFFLGLGLLLAFTPCVLPMLPILVNILVGTNAPLSSRRALTLASLYVLSIAICYACAGVVAGLMGSQLQLALQKPVFLIALSILLIVFAFNQLELFKFPLPQFFSQGLDRLQRKQKQGSAFGAIAMGGISALMVSPCVTPALVGALTYIGQTGNALLGGFALFAMALGMGLPLLGVAFVGGHLLPKAGAWMGTIKIITGILLLALAGSMLLRAFPTHPSTEALSRLDQRFTSIQNTTELQAALKNAESLRKTVVLDVYADWCISCRQLDQEVFANPSVLALLKNTVLLRLDITTQTAENEALQKNLKIIGPPTLLFFKPDGVEADPYRLVGKPSSKTFIAHVEEFLKLHGPKH